MTGCFHYLWIVSSLFLLGYKIGDGVCLKNVSLKILPPAVPRNQSASLICQYDLERHPLYSVKWYRGRYEFYRYSPNEEPIKKSFPYPGIEVDLSMSNESAVVLRKVDFGLSGNFSCEVTVDAPLFSTKTVIEQMLVVEPPEKKPEINTEKKRYEPGDILRANCTSPPSKPPANLSFLLNNIPVGVPVLRHYDAHDSRQSSALSLVIQLESSHYNNGELVLSCTGYLSHVYRETTEVQLGYKVREPLPEKRVTSPNRASRIWLSRTFQVIVCMIGYLAVR